MCGIAGIFAYGESAPGVDKEALQRIHDYQARRGPDGEGQWQSATGHIVLSHKRLAIIDLTADASQPMVTGDGRMSISFNGEIYNYRSLRQELEAKGYRFRSNSDTEVLLNLYRDRGAAMLHDLSGMFAFALWDEDRQGIFLARDPYGIKPLYYSDNGNTLCFASQVKALLAGDVIDTAPDAAGYAGYYLFGSVPEPYTLYRGIKSLKAGHSMWLKRAGKACSQQYFSIARVWADAEESTQNQESARSVRQALRDSVERHCVSDVPVGCFLSAGIDSGALLGLMTEVSASPVQTISLKFSEFAGSADDETPLAEHTARYYGAQHRTREITQAEFQQDLPAILNAMDQPSIDGINTWFVSKAATELGLKVAVSGLGGDELFAGYSSFHSIPQWVRFCTLPALIPGLGVGLRKIAQHWPGLHPKAPGMLEFGGSFAGAYLLKRGLFMPWEIEQFQDLEFLTGGLQELQPLKHIQAQLEGFTLSPYANIATLESSLYLRNQLLRDADWAGMAHGLEIRTPLVDSQLLKSLAPLLLQLKPGQGKKLLASAPGKALPEEIVSRPKTGFQTPIKKWLNEMPAELLPDPVIHCRHPLGWHWSRHWSMRVGAAF